MGSEWLPTPPPPAPRRIAHGDRNVVHLSPEVAAALSLVAAHDGLTASQAIARLIADRAEAIGIANLLDGVSPGAQAAPAGLRPEGADARSRLPALPGVASAAATKADRPSPPLRRSERGRAAPGSANDKQDKNS